MILNVRTGQVCLFTLRCLFKEPVDITSLHHMFQLHFKYIFTGQLKHVQEDLTKVILSIKLKGIV